MRKYLTWRCIGLHLLMVVLVPTFLLAGWWQYHVALGGNTLSWVYTVEWPFFAVYAVYVWWKMIHDQTTLFDRLWAAKQRAAADDSGRPLHEIPGWAMDKSLSKEVVQASMEAARRHALGHAEPDALESSSAGRAVRPVRLATRAFQPELAERAAATLPREREGEGAPAADEAVVVDARVLDVKRVADDELDAYNRYLAELSFRDPPKRWRRRR